MSKDSVDIDKENDHHRDSSSSPPPAKKKSSSKSDPATAAPMSTGSLLVKTGSTYIPPAKLRQMQQEVEDKSSEEYQRISWEALKKSIHGLIINKVNTSNIGDVVRELFRENLLRGRGILCRSILVAQAASPKFTPVYAALVAVINTRFPRTGELIIKRLIMDFKTSFRRKNKERCLTSGRFLAHLCNQKVAHEIVLLEIISLLLEQPTNVSVEIAVSVIKESGQFLTKVSPKILFQLFEQLRIILNEAEIDTRVQYMIEVLIQIRRDGYKDHPAIPENLDLVEEAEQITHFLLLEDNHDIEEKLNVFQFDANFLENEDKYKEAAKELLDEVEHSDESGSSDDDDGEESEEEAEDGAAKTADGIIDNTETDLVNFRRTVYLTIRSSISVDETAHKLMKIQLKPGQEYEMANMILDCCAQLRAYDKKYGFLGQRFCMLNRAYVEQYERIFVEQYNIMHRLDTVKIRNVSNFFSHLLFTDAISWGVMQVIRITEEDTTSSARIFLKILFQELCRFLSIPKVNERFQDVTMQPFFEGIFPRENPKDTRFSINFFTAIGLGGLTVEMRNFLKEPSSKKVKSDVEEEGESSSEDSSSSEEEESSSDSSSDSDKEEKKKKKSKKSLKKKLKEKPKTTMKERVEKEAGSHGKQKERRSVERDAATRNRKDRGHRPRDTSESPKPKRGRQVEDVKHTRGRGEEINKNGHIDSSRGGRRDCDRSRSPVSRSKQPKGRENRGRSQSPVPRSKQPKGREDRKYDSRDRDLSRSPLSRSKKLKVREDRGRSQSPLSRSKGKEDRKEDQKYASRDRDVSRSPVPRSKQLKGRDDKREDRGRSPSPLSRSKGKEDRKEDRKYASRDRDISRSPVPRSKQLKGREHRSRSQSPLSRSKQPNGREDRNYDSRDRDSSESPITRSKKPKGKEDRKEDRKYDSRNRNLSQSPVSRSKRREDGRKDPYRSLSPVSRSKQPKERKDRRHDRKYDSRNSRRDRSSSDDSRRNHKNGRSDRRASPPRREKLSKPVHSSRSKERLRRSSTSSDEHRSSNSSSPGERKDVPKYRKHSRKENSSSPIVERRRNR